MDSIRLLNEIDMLLTQLELYLKQAKTATADETARPNEPYQAGSCNRVQHLPSQLQLRQNRLTEKDVSIGNCNSEIEQARAAFAELQRRLAALQDELQQDATTNQLEQTLRDEIERLRAEGQEKHFLLGSRNEEVVQAKAELDQLRVRVTELETTAVQSAAEAAAENELMQTEFQAQLALLQAELSQREWALEEKQAIVNGLEKRFNARIQDLQTQLANRQIPPETRSGDTLLGAPASSTAQNRNGPTIEEQIMAFESESQTRRSENHSRRWHTGRAWKRRWRLF